MRCLLRLITQNKEVVPRQLLSSDSAVGQELPLATQYYKMNSINEKLMNEAIEEFKFNLIASIFGAFKRNYHNICTFKANKAIKIARDCMTTWRAYGKRKAINRENSNKFNFNCIIKRY